MSLPTSPPLQLLHRLDKSSSDFHDQLCSVLYGEEYVQCVPHLQRDDVVWLVNYLDTVLDGLDPPSPGFRKCLRVLRSVCGTGAILPKSYTIQPHLLKICPEPFASGGYGDVYEGTLDGLKVCVKRVRVYTKDGPRKAARIFCQEAIMWKHLVHPNILSLLGVTPAPFQLISIWMPGGDLPEYIKNNSNADRLGLLSDVANGLYYLHSCNVIHGDLKGPNILVDDTGHARIADFGLATVTQNLDSMQSASGQRGHTVRWAAPEVLTDGTYSKEADIFSFAMVMIEVFTGAIPFSESSSLMAMLAITQGKRPPHPTHPTFTENLWRLMQRCWNDEPHLRPEVSEALRVLLDPDIPIWKQLITHSLSTHERISLITEIFSHRDQIETVRRLDGDNAQRFIDTVDEFVNQKSDSLPPSLRRECLHNLSKICGLQARIPTSLNIPLCYDRSEPPLYRGGYGDICKGEYCGQSVAAKTLRVYRTANLGRIARGFCKEVMIWRSLRHPNVLPLLGVTMTGIQLVVVSKWMVNGTINEFVKAFPDWNRVELLEGVTEGLIYMHTEGIFHGNLKGVNILINDNCQPCLADFANLNLLGALSDQTSASTGSGNAFARTIRWMSPERLSPETFDLRNSRPTKESDCYALGMVIYEVLARRAPFATRRDYVLLRMVLEGERPERPREEWFPDSIWEMLARCWKNQPNERPSLDAVLRCLQDTAQQWAPPPNTETDDWMLTDEETDSDNQSCITMNHPDFLITSLPITTDSVSPTMPGDYGLPTSPLDSPIVTTAPTIMQDDGRPPDPPQTGNREEGGLLACMVRKVFRHTRVF